MNRIKGWLLRIRMWLLTLLAGKSTIAINCHILGTLVVDNKNSVIVNCMIIGNETTNVGIKFKDCRPV